MTNDALLWALTLTFLFLGLILGVLITWLLRKLRVLGTTAVVVVNPQTQQAHIELRRPTDDKLWLGKMGKPGAGVVSVGMGTVFNADGRGFLRRPVLLVDGHAAAALQVDAATKSESRLLYPNGKTLADLEVNTAIEKVNKSQQGMDIKTLAVIVVLGFVIVVGMLIYGVTKISAHGGG